MPVTVIGLSIYPIKSARAVELETLDVAQSGTAGDRAYVVVFADGPNAGRFITQRDRGCEKLAAVTALPAADEGLALSAPGMPDLIVAHSAQESTQVKVWKDDCQGFDQGDAAAKWLSEYLGVACRLIKAPAVSERLVDQNYATAADHVFYADDFPLLLTNTASLDALNAEIGADAAVPMARFRPNIVISGLEAFEEDTILRLKIGEAELELVKPCSRCKITTIDQKSGMAGNGEPLTTLAKLRRGKGDGVQGVFFGENAVVCKAGVIRRGDPVEIISRKPLHAAIANVKLSGKPKI